MHDDVQKINNAEARYRSLIDLLIKMKKVVVSFSGGVDSALLLKAAKDALGENVTAITASSETTPRLDHCDAVDLAQQLDVEHIIIKTHELEIEDFVKNSANRCYICKTHRIKTFFHTLDKFTDYRVIDGGNAEDHLDFRPGNKATKELGVRSPMAEVGLTKEDIRLLSRQYGLNTWNKPSMACLASRIPYGKRITAEKLSQVDQAETWLRKLGICHQIRVRHYGETAKIEVDSKSIAEITVPFRRMKVVHEFKRIGFRYVTIDMEGYVMGSLNRSIKTE